MDVVSILNVLGGQAAGKVYETPTLSGNYNDFLIPDLYTYSTIVFNASGDVNLKGLDSTLVKPWQWWFIQNNSEQKIKCEYNKGSSLANNRFDGDKAFDIKKNTPSILLRNGITNKFHVFKLS